MDVDFAVCVASLFVNCAMSFDVVLYIRLCVYVCVCVLIHLFISPLRYVLIHSVNHLCFCFCFYFYLLQLTSTSTSTHLLTHSALDMQCYSIRVCVAHAFTFSLLSLPPSISLLLRFCISASSFFYSPTYSLTLHRSPSIRIYLYLYISPIEHLPP